MNSKTKNKIISRKDPDFIKIAIDQLTYMIEHT